MTTIACRRFVSTPQRDAASTWRSITDLLTRGAVTAARTELLAVAGIAASIITDKAPQKAAIVVACDGPRTRIYCLYDEDALDGAVRNEEPLGYDPLKGNWHVSLPCASDDLAWVQAALKKHSSRISARDEAEALGAEAEDVGDSKSSVSLNLKGFFEP
jgi:hypothetical protein